MQDNALLPLDIKEKVVQGIIMGVPWARQGPSGACYLSISGPVS